MPEINLDVTGMVTAVFRLVYNRRSPCALESRRPYLKWFPKYTARLRVPRSVHSADDPSTALEQVLDQRGFTLSHWTRDAVFFKRGKRWGDFSVKLVPLIVSFPRPLEQNGEMVVAVSGVCLFDTGDLWKLTTELRELIEST